MLMGILAALDPVVLTKIGGMLLYMAVEYWLGKTDKVKAGSVPEALLLAAKSAASTLKGA